MELALPHVVVWTRGPGLGTDLVAALAAHPVEVSEVRGLIEARRAAVGRRPMLVVLMCPVDTITRVAEAAAEFPGKPILLFADTPDTLATVTLPADTWIEERPADQPLQEICWQVIETLGRTAPSLEGGHPWRHALFRGVSPGRTSHPAGSRKRHRRRMSKQGVCSPA